MEYYTARERMSTDAQNYMNESYKEVDARNQVQRVPFHFYNI